MKRFFYTLLLGSMISSAALAQEFDDIYYNPKKDTASAASKTNKNAKSQKQSYYIEDFSNVDVDDYNRRGQYYTSPIDTIGTRGENQEDFVYTQQIQKFYNPTIVVDNADLLADIINNSYGNVEVVYDYGNPCFSSIYTWPGYYNNYNWNISWTGADPLLWGPSWTWAWRPSFYFGWGYGPAYGWGPNFGWGWSPIYDWGPSWAWGPSYYPGYYPGHYPGYFPGWYNPGPYAQYRPNGRTPNRPGQSWASNTRPGGNYAGAGSSSGYNRRPGNTVRPSGSSVRPSGAPVSNKGGNVYTDYHRGSSNRTSGYSVGGSKTYNSNVQVSNNGSFRGSNSNNSNNHNNSTYNSNSNRTSNSSTYNRSSNSGYNRGSVSTGSYGGSRSTGGGGGGGRGRHR